MFGMMIDTGPEFYTVPSLPPYMTLTYMWTLPDHPGAFRKWSLTPALPWVRQNLPDVKIQKKKKKLFFYFK